MLHETAELPDTIDSFRRVAVQRTDQSIFALYEHATGALVRVQGIESEAVVASVKRYALFLRLIEGSEFRGLESSVYIDDDVRRQGATVFSLIRPMGSMTATVPPSRLPANLFRVYFWVQSDDYVLAFWQKDERFVLFRNGSHVELLEPGINAPFVIAISWKDDEIGIAGHVRFEGGTGRKKEYKQTLPVVPPNGLYTWARRELLLPSRTYATPGDVLNVVASAFQKLGDEISRLNDTAGFWDECREGHKVTTVVPKREPLVTRHIEGLLRDVTLQKGINIHRELELGNSKLDLLMSAPLANGEMCNICVEVKKAHAKDLAHGLCEQLPEYMRRLGTDHGVFCVLSYGQKYPHQVAPFAKYGLPPDLSAPFTEDTSLLLNLAKRARGLKHIVSIVLDVSVQASASKT